MGFFDRFRRKSSAPDPGDELHHPDLPARAEIVTFDVADAVGTLRFEDGSSLRFGASACRDFQPLVGVVVQVVEVGVRPHGGARATKVVVDPKSASKARALAEARDRELGYDPEADDPVATALLLGTVTVLLDAPLGRDRASIEAYFEGAGVLGGPVALEFAPSPNLVINGRRLRVFAGDRPFPAEGIDLRMVGADVPLGGGFITLSTGLASIDEMAPVLTGTVGPDPWAEDGAMRLLTKVVAKLARGGRHVLLHRAGHVVFSAEAWFGRLGDPEDPACRPFSAWIDIGFTPDKARLATWGSSVAQRPDVSVELSSADSDAAYELGQQALLLGAYTIARENRLLEVGETLFVPPGLGIGPDPVAGGDAGLIVDATCARFVVANDDKGNEVLRFEAHGEPIPDVWTRVVRGVDEPFGFFPYRTLLTAQISSLGPEVGAMPRYETPAPVPPFNVFVYDRGDDFALVTCGLGRVRQPGSEVGEDVAHVELLIGVPQHGPEIAAALADFAMFLHAKPPGAPPWRPNEIVRFDDPIGPSRYYALGFAGQVPVAPDARITLLAPIPLTDAELEDWRASDARPEWVAARGQDPAVWARWVL